MKDLSSALAALRDQHNYRVRAVVDGPQDIHIIIDGARYLSFCSNDYLGLAHHPAVIDAFKAGVDRYGVGSGASHLVTGHQRAHHELEEALAEFTHRPRALLFSTGYMANLSVIAALLGRGDVIFEDRLNHASLLDAGQLSGARLKRYAHNDVAALARLCVREDACAAEHEEHARNRLVVTDGVFSMDGDLAPLPALAATAQRYDAWLMVDDAHGFGVLGATGRGSLEHFELGIDAAPILVGTLGKAFGTFGAFVAGNEDLIEYLIQRARPYIYTTALPPAIAYATLTSLRIAREEDWRRAHLHALIARFRRGAKQLGARLMHSETPIQPLLVGDAEQALVLSAALRARGIYITAIRPPTIPTGTARLRITFSAAHGEADVDRLLDALETVL